MEMYDAVSHGVGRALLQSSSKSTSTRVLGVGPGVFILGFFAILTITALVPVAYGLLCLVLLTSEREYDSEDASASDDVGYENQVISRSVVALLMAVYVLAGSIGWLALHSAHEIRAGGTTGLNM
ncbi:hypothetical protein PPROV_000612100 [Pycnococcus provasolii]|uniref:Uncharacterized protein n=1 Tax=Pycnococcus provasolii TaxID=41880 RepID=A0A830HQT4_9CHLO|nr:hypothetical protein PPROV_000612100 [Pycnococcus provasolii]